MKKFTIPGDLQIVEEQAKIALENLNYTLGIAGTCIQFDIEDENGDRFNDTGDYGFDGDDLDELFNHLYDIHFKEFIRKEFILQWSNDCARDMFQQDNPNPLDAFLDVVWYVFLSKFELEDYGAALLQRSKQVWRERLQVSPELMEEFIRYGKVAVKFYRKWEEHARQVPRKRVAFAELLNAFSDIMSGEAPSKLVSQFAAVDCLRTAYLGFLVEALSPALLRKSLEIPFSAMQMFQATDGEDTVHKMYWFTYPDHIEVCDEQFEQLFEHDFTKEIVEERGRAQQIAEDERLARQLEEGDDFPIIEEGDDFPIRQMPNVRRQLFGGGNGIRQSGGKPCGMPPWHLPPRYADNAYNRRRFKGQTPPLCPSKTRKAPPHSKVTTTKKKKTTAPRSTKQRRPKKKKTTAPRSTKQRRRQRRKSSGSDSVIRRRSTSSAPDTWDIIEDVLNRGKRIGGGKQAEVYAYKGYAWKIYNDGFQRAAVRENLDFLERNRKTGVVPKLYDGSARDGWIKMQLLKNYKPLSAAVLTKTPEYRNQLLRAIARARARLSKSTEYSDLRKWDNIAVRHDDSGSPVRVKFYEGGKPDQYPDKLRAWQYVMNMGANLRIKSQPFHKRVKAGRVNWLTD